MMSIPMLQSAARMLAGTARRTALRAIPGVGATQMAVWPTQRGFASSTLRQDAPADGSSTPDLRAQIAAKLQQSPEFLNALSEFQAALRAKGIGPEELGRPSIRLMQVLMDKDVRNKTEAMANAMRTAGVTDEEVRHAAKAFAGSGFLSKFNFGNSQSPKPDSKK